MACFSPYHFHRLFRAWTGESLSAYIQRLRLEQAAHQMCYNPGKSITDIALDCGFGSASAFARAFRAHHGETASEWWSGRNRKPDQGDRKTGKAATQAGIGASSPPGRARAPEASMTPLSLSVRIEDLPDLTLAYLRHTGAVPDGMDLFPGLVRRLRAWAGARAPLGPESLSILLYPDNPKEWLPGSGWQLDDRPLLQITRQPPGLRHVVDLCLPVRPF